MSNHREKISIALPPMPLQGAHALRRAWQQALSDPRPSVPADEVLDRLERKYQAAVTGTTSRS
jgi:hypothetical protein